MKLQKKTLFIVRTLIFLIGTGLFVYGIKGLNHRFSPLTKKFTEPLTEYNLKTNDFKNIYDNYFSSDAKRKVFDILIESYESVVKEKKYDLLALMSALEPKHEKVVVELVNILEKHEDKLLLPLAIKHLSKTKSKLVAIRIPDFLKNGDEHIKVASLNAVTDLCLENGKELLNIFMVDEENENLVRFAKKKMTQLSICSK